MRKRHVEATKRPATIANPKVVKRIDALVKKLEKGYGKGIAMRLTEDTESDLSGGCISTGFQAIDDILTGMTDEELDTIEGSGHGFPRGRMIEVFGPESSGKTTVALMAIAECQKNGGTAAFVDAEHALDITYAKSLGVNIESLLISQTDSAEQALNIVEMLVREGIDLIVVDSVAALVPEKEIAGEMGDSHMGLQARLMSQACRKLTGLLSPGGPTVVWINQLRMKLGIRWGNPETTTGGNALKFYASIRCDVRRIKVITKTRNGEKKQVGVLVRLKTVKNKVAPPFREIIYQLNYGKGIRIPDKSELAFLRKPEEED